MLKAVEYKKSIGVGVTKPQLLRADDGRLYVVKFTSNRLGAKALANEFIGSRLGKKLELDFPPAETIELSEEALTKLPRLQKHGVPAGVHFAIRYLRHASYVQPWHIRQAVNRHAFAGVILFDHILQNEDRTLNGCNLLVRRETDGLRLYAIDNTHLFGSGCWRRENLYRYREVVHINQRRAYGMLLRHCLKAADFEPYIKRAQAISAEKINAMLDEMPSAWLDAADKKAVGEYLLWRFSMTGQIYDALSRLLPDKHRRPHRHELKN